MASANGVDPDTIPTYIMWNVKTWRDDHPDSNKWIEANYDWLLDNFENDLDTSTDEDDNPLFSSDDDGGHFDPFEDDPTESDARWSP